MYFAKGYIETGVRSCEEVSSITLNAERNEKGMTEKETEKEINIYKNFLPGMPLSLFKPPSPVHHNHNCDQNDAWFLGLDTFRTVESTDYIKVPLHCGSERKYCGIHSSIRSFTHTTHTTRLFAPSLTLELMEK